MRTLAFTLLLGSLAALTACGDTDKSGDDSGPEASADSDGDGLTDAEEASLGTDPNAADSDGDGLDDLTEVNAGLDPLDTDTDDDEVDDATELNAGSDGLSCSSVPDGYWPNCLALAQADGVSGEGWAQGNVLNDWQAVDQFGNSVDFHQFYGSVIVLDLSAGWCGPCNQAAPSMETTYQTYKDQGFVMLHLMIDDWSYDGAVTQSDFQADWAQTHSLTFPVVVDTSGQSGYAEAYVGLYYEGYVEGVPTFAVFDRELRMVAIWSGENQQRMIREIEDHL